MLASPYASRGRILVAPLLAAAIGFATPALVQGLAAGPSSASPPASAWSMSHVIRHRTVSVDGIDIFFRETGPKDAPVILLLHGLPSSSHMFRHLMLLLADRFRVIAPD